MFEKQCVVNKRLVNRSNCTSIQVLKAELCLAGNSPKGNSIEGAPLGLSNALGCIGQNFMHLGETTI